MPSSPVAFARAAALASGIPGVASATGPDLSVLKGVFQTQRLQRALVRRLVVLR